MEMHYSILLCVCSKVFVIKALFYEEHKCLIVLEEYKYKLVLKERLF